MAGWSLKTLIMSFVDVPPEMIYGVLRCCPELTQLEWDTCDDPDAVVDALSCHCPKLTRLKMQYLVEGVPGDLIPCLVAGCPMLRDLSLDASLFNDCSLQALAQLRLTDLNLHDLNLHNMYDCSDAGLLALASGAAGQTLQRVTLSGSFIPHGAVSTLRAKCNTLS